MNIDFDTDKIILVKYFPESGGKFLINCIGLGDNAVFQDSGLARLQIEGNFPHSEKLQLLLDRLNQTKKLWSDLSLGDTRYWGSSDFINDNTQYNPTVAQVIAQGWYACKVIHYLDQERLFSTKWKHAKSIRLYNTSAFCQTYRPTHNKNMVKYYWNKIAGNDWPSAPMSVQDFDQLPNSVLHELENNFEDSLNVIKNFLGVKNILLPHDEPNTIYWNTDWYLDEDFTVANVEKIYQEFGINGFNPDSIRIYRKTWLEILTKLNKQTVLDN